MAVNPAPANVTDGSILSVDEVDSYSLTINDVLGGGSLNAELAATSGTLAPRLTLARADGGVLIQSDSGGIAQHLEPGTYLLRVSAQTGQGNYQLSTQFTPTQDPFQPPGTGKRPTVAVADVNGDGFDDLLTANYLGNNVSVLLGAGDGSFQAFTNFDVGPGLLGVPAADLNGDGFLDIVTGNYLSSETVTLSDGSVLKTGTVSVLLGNGDGTFQAARNFTTGDGALWPVIAEVNGDDIPDIITGNYRAGTVSVLLGHDDGTGNGDGTFETQPEIRVGGTPAFVSVADVNGDGRLDIISPNGGTRHETDPLDPALRSNDTLSVLLNMGTEAGGAVTFQDLPVIATDGFPFAVGIADFNGDGKPDLASAHRNDDSVRLQLGNGFGTFGAEASFAAGDTAYAMAVADLNGDGRPDVAVTNRNAGTVSVLLGKGNGTFQPQIVIPVGQRPLTIQISDVNRDLHPDILVGNADDNTVSVLLGRGDGTFSFPASAASAAVKRPVLFAVGDLSGDGHPDIVTANSSNGSVSVLLGATGGSFQPNQVLDVGEQPIGAAMADFNGDGKLDLVVTNKANDTVSVLLARSAGGFEIQETFPVGTKPLYVATADLNGDNRPDIVVTNNTGSSVCVLLRDDHGGFARHVEFPIGATPYGVAVADVNGDGIPDIVASNYGDKSISVLLGIDDGSGHGDGTFQDQLIIDNVGNLPSALALGKVNGDDFLDIVVALAGDNKVAVLLGDGRGSFQTAPAFETGGVPTGVALVDFNNDSFLDVVVSNRADNSVSVLLGNGDGTLEAHQTHNVGRQPFSVAATDVSGDGIPDIVTANASDSTVSVLLGHNDGSGHGDGSFSPQSPFALGKRPYAVVVADVSGDGNPDSITANYNTGTVSVSRGNGNGSFQAPQSFTVGGRPLAVAFADLNRDDRFDLVTANSADNSVSVLLGNGDGSFQSQQAIHVGQRPSDVAAADINGDGNLDLIVSNYDDDSVSVLLGRGDGSFQPQSAAGRFDVGNGPNALSVADLNNDRKLDIVVTNIFGNTASVLLNDGTNGNASFQSQATFAVGAQPYDVVVADVDGDGKPDLITANYGGNSVSVLRGNGMGSFGVQQIAPVGERPVAVSVADVNGDQHLDLVTTNRRDGTLSILLNDGGTFTLSQTLDAGVQPVSTAVTNVNGDGRPSIITVNYSNSTPRVLLASTSSFNPATPGNATESLNNTALVDLTRDGIRDSVILDASGDVLFRQGLAGSDGAFVPPVILNANRRARDLTVVNTGSGLSVATADSSFDPVLSAAANQFLYTVSLYAVSAGSVTRTTAFSSMLLPTRIVAADLTGDGRDDLVVANSLDNSIQVSFQQPNHSFSAPLTLTTGEAPSNLVLVDVNGDGLRDIVATDQASGDVSVFLNDISHSFSTRLRYRAGNGLFGLDTTGPAPVVASLLQSVSLAAGDFTGHGFNDLVVVNRGTHSFSVLSNNGRGGFDNSSLSLTTSTSDGFDINNQPGAVVAGDFNRDTHLDLAVLMEDTGQLWIYTGAGNGTFDHTFTISVGDQATGLSVIPGSSDGLLDLLVGNGFGDVLHLASRGDGTFQIRGNRVSLSVVPDLFGSGQAGVLVGNQQGNMVTVQAANSGGTGFDTVATLGNASQLAPGDVQWSLLARGATIPDAIVVSTGGNAVIVYHTTAITNGVPIFAPDPRTYFVGSAPASVTVADLNSDSIPDMLVANKGSNDVSVLFGSYASDGTWIGNAGPRLHSGGAGPIAMAVRNLNADLIPDLAVTNGSSGTMTMLPGVGGGFFDDRQPQRLFNLGGAVDQPPTFQPNVGTGIDTGIGFAVTTTGNLVRFDLSHLNIAARTVFTSSQLVAARALPNGQVVVANADGTVNLLSPQGNRLIVSAVLQAQSGQLISPSSLVIVQQASGQFQVLVSSQGSNTVSVFAAAAAVQPIQFFIPIAGNSSQSSASFNSAFTNFATLLNSTSFSSSFSATTGISLSNILSGNNLVFTATSSAALVAVAGNTYSTVAVLDFGGQRDDDSGDGRGRMLWLSTRYPVGERSPLAQFVIGIKDAINEYRGDTTETPASRDDGAPRNDPWNMNMFQRTRSPRASNGKDSPKADPKRTDAPRVPAATPKPEASGDEQSAIDAFWRQCPEIDAPLFVPAAVARTGLRFDLCAMILAGVLFTQNPNLDSARDDKHSTPRSR